MSRVQAVVIDAPTTGVGTRLVEAFDPAMLAKQMIGLFAAKFIAGQVIPAFHQIKLIMRYEQVKETGARANGTIAIEHFRPRFGLRGETNCTAMASSSNVNHGSTAVV